jgi:2-C-methyl-D-erythritol 4-phosphate cytidylyltransferase
MGLQIPKQFIDLSGKPLLIYTLEVFCQAPFIEGLFLVVPAHLVTHTREMVQRHLHTQLEIMVIEGGIHRQDSVFNGLKELPPECDWVIVHDGVRPFVTLELLEATWRGAQNTGAAIAALPSTDTVKRVVDQRVLETLPREHVWLVQTPQAFRKDILLQAYKRARTQGWLGTDDASLVEQIGIPVSAVQGERTNIKVTTPEDLKWAHWFLEKNFKARR